MISSNQECQKTELKPKEFLDWIYHRLKFRYSEQEDILDMVAYILQNYTLIRRNIKLPDDLIEKICRKHYADFDMDRVPEMGMGYTEEERKNLKIFVSSVIKEALS